MEEQDKIARSIVHIHEQFLDHDFSTSFWLS
jgi:hypothetical protein